MTNEAFSITWRRIPFEEARIEEIGDDFSPILVVEGVSPYANMRIELNPLVYATQPEYWGIEVVGCLSRVALPSVSPFEVVLPLDFRLGSKGLEVIGPSKKVVRIDWIYAAKSNPDDGRRIIVLGERRALANGGASNHVGQ